MALCTSLKVDNLCIKFQEALQTYEDDMSPVVSSRQLTHYLQLHMSGRFHKFDFEDKNMIHYGASHPPEYDLNNVTTPIYLYAASEDRLISLKDVKRLSALLPNVIDVKILKDWNHMDVVLGKNTRKELFHFILKAMNGQLVNKTLK